MMGSVTHLNLAQSDHTSSALDRSDGEDELRNRLGRSEVENSGRAIIVESGHKDATAIAEGDGAACVRTCSISKVSRDGTEEKSRRTSDLIHEVGAIVKNNLVELDGVLPRELEPSSHLLVTSDPLLGLITRVVLLVTIDNTINSTPARRGILGSRALSARRKSEVGRASSDGSLRGGRSLSGRRGSSRGLCGGSR